jgi:predicted HTH domain antitoxin
MQLTLDLPDELVDRLEISPGSMPLHVIETLTVSAYQAGQITSAEVGRILGMPSRWEVDAFLKAHQAYLHYDEADLAQDLDTLRQLRWSTTDQGEAV